MSAEQTSSSCPDTIELSALLDGLETPPGVAEHVESCGLCTAILTAYQKADYALSRSLTPPPSLKKSVRDAVNRAAYDEPEVATSWWMMPMFRLAAAFAVTTGALGILVAVLGRGPTTSPELATIEPQPDHNVGALASSESPITGTSQAVDKVAVSGGKDAVSMTGGMEAMAEIPARVRHVWSVDDVDASIDLLKKRLPKGSYEFGVENGNPFAQVVLPDERVQNLVNDLAELKWMLVNSDLPQPSQAVILTGRNVHYRLVLAGKND